MKIDAINNYNLYNKPIFMGVKEATAVWEESMPTIQNALKLLGDKNIAILMHGNSFPSAKGEDIGIGSPYTNGAKEFADFFGGLTDKCVLGPWGITNASSKHSPYNSTLESLNPFFINFKYLTTKNGGNLISKKTFDEVVKQNHAEANQVNYEYVENATKKMLDEAYSNYTSRLSRHDSLAIKLCKEFSAFKQTSNGIYMDAIFNALTNEYKTSNFKEWNNLDKCLPILLEKNDKRAIARLNKINKTYETEIDKYMFTQFLAKEHTKMAPLKYVADKQVAIERNDAWKLQDIILDKIGRNDVCLGVPADSFSDKGRCWGMPQIDIKKVFNKDGTLSNGGRRLFNIYRKIFRENRGGVRIDHFQGIIDPYICINNSAEPEDGAGRLLSSPGHRLLKAYSIITKDNIDKNRKPGDYKHIKYLSDEQINRYAKFFEDVILEAAKVEGLDETCIMPEDLGAITRPTVEVMQKDNLGSMKVTQFVNPEKRDHMYRGINSKPIDFITTGTHDSKPLVSYISDMNQEKYGKHLKMLTTDLNIKHPATKTDRRYGIKLKFAELFVAPARNVQIFFSHLMGMNSWYNKPGDKTVKKWSLRMPNDFREIYFRNLIEGTAFNPYDALRRALKAKGNKDNNQMINKLYRYERKLIKEFRR